MNSSWPRSRSRSGQTDKPADEAWRAWAAQVVPEFTHEAVIAWLDAGQPDPEAAAGKILRAVNAIIEAANSPGS